MGQDRSGRAVSAARRGGPEVLEERPWMVPAPKAGEVLVETHAAGVAVGDVLLREGLKPGVSFPAVPGYDAAGVVVAVGDGVSSPHIGERVVVWVGGVGGYATHAVVPAWAVVPLPDEVTFPVAAALTLNYLTAYQMLRAAGVRAGATVVVHPAGGLVGRAVLDLGRLRGLTMIGTASGAKLAAVTEAGATAVDYRHEDYRDRVRSLAPDGVDAVFDGVGAPSWRAGLHLLRPGGRLVVYGVASGTRRGRRDLAALARTALTAPRSSYLTLFTRAVGVIGYRVDAWVPADVSGFRADLTEVLRLAAEGDLRPPPVRAWPLAAAAEAHRGLAAAPGKTILVPREAA